MIENLSVVVFFATWWFYRDGLRYPTLALIIWMTGFIVLSKIWGQKLTKFQVITWLVIVFFGGFSVLFNDDSIIKWVTTVRNSIVSMIFLSSHFIGKYTIMERICKDKLLAPPEKLRNLNLMIVLYLLMVATLNWFVATYYETDVFMYFKTFGLLGVHMVFTFAGLYYLKDYLRDFIERLEK